MLMLASLLLAVVAPVPSSPLAGLHGLVGSWSCTYHAGGTDFAYRTTYTYDRDGHILRQTASWTGGGDEEYVAYDALHRRWTATVLDDGGNATVMRAPGSDPNHIAYHSVYPDASMAVTFDRLSATQYALHATVRSGGNTTTSVDTCKKTTAGV